MNEQNIKSVYDIKEEINKLEQENNAKIKEIEFRIYCKIK